MDRLASISAFVRVAENGGFSAAARSLSVLTTTVSDHVHALESALGVRLLNRATRRVSLNEIRSIPCPNPAPSDCRHAWVSNQTIRSMMQGRGSSRRPSVAWGAGRIPATTAAAGQPLDPPTL